MTYFSKDCSKKALKTYKSIVIENFKPVHLSPIKWRPFKVFAKLHKSPLLIVNIVKDTVSRPRTFSIQLQYPYCLISHDVKETRQWISPSSFFFKM